MSLTELDNHNSHPLSGVPNVPWGIRDLLVAIILAALAILALNLILVAVNALFHLSLGQNPDVLLVVGILTDLIIIGVACLFSVVRYHVGWDALGLRRYPAALGCALSAGMLVLAYLTRFIYGIIALALGLQIEQQDVLTHLDMQGAGLLLSFFVAAILAPIAEEIFFRGFLYAGLRGRMGVMGAMLVTTLFFTALHLSLGLFIPIFVLGLFLAWIYEHTGSLVPGIFLHIANNALSLLLFYVMIQNGLVPTPGLLFW